MKYVTFLIALSILPLLGCSDGGPLEVTSSGSRLDTATPARVDVTRPFQGYFRTTFGEPGDPGFDCDGNPDTQPSLIEGIGQATHLGRATYVSDSEIDFLTLIQCGRGMFITTDGDQVQFNYVGHFTIPDDEGNITFSGDWWVLGGTGRFGGATGGGTYNGAANAFVEQGEVSFLGTLVY